jgi:lysozyme
MLIIDVSSHNAEPDWKKLRAGGVGGVIIKASEGAHYIHPNFQTWRKSANAAGLRVGAYHFARPDKNNGAVGAEAEAAHFVAAVSKVNRTDIRPTLDFETAPPDEGWARDWNAVVKKGLGVGPLFYSYPAFIKEMRASKPIGYGLWLASFSVNDGHEHSYLVPKPWKKALIHQYTSNGHVYGEQGRIDIDSFGYDPHKFHQTGGWNPAILAHPFTGLL